MITPVAKAVLKRRLRAEMFNLIMLSTRNGGDELPIRVAALDVVGKSPDVSNLVDLTGITLDDRAIGVLGDRNQLGDKAKRDLGNLTGQGCPCDFATGKPDKSGFNAFTAGFAGFDGRGKVLEYFLIQQGLQSLFVT